MMSSILKNVKSQLEAKSKGNSSQQTPKKVKLVKAKSSAFIESANAATCTSSGSIIQGPQKIYGNVKKTIKH